MASAEEVAGGLVILRKADQTFAVCTQGHMPIPGAADISNGVLMVTSSLNSVQYVDDSKFVVQIGAGNRWLDVYEANAQQNSDLCWALKGGAFNFGIVTRFDLTTLSVPYMWGGNAYYDASALDPLVNPYAISIPQL
ncbi:hypothetical protein DL766_006437 [Monosporascus sp. MC13-8B]|uniref:FAD linked oxidase N-terminal domain-containing protein n=1 Tax=Monosporascus cannonballus TaxID=155416 RepID=A0ABY0HCF4_9PEZI|nr:hypothetical protein DL762_002976 [Monosporascus cannonballus]RYO96627.1 hypothetical protein DL763_003113 [Monosporascus cannonballus]RYP27375.1 hypothetical protein DL766_006437 [Monosporascus sp. MC13-8B]